MSNRAEVEVAAKAEPKTELSHCHVWRDFSMTRAQVDNNAAYDVSWNDQVLFVSFHDIVLRDGEVSEPFLVNSRWENASIPVRVGVKIN